jgi:hypothetical protein
MGPVKAAEFPHQWRAEVLAKPPLIAPARQFVYPQQIAGEEDALARGALLVQVQPAVGGAFLATCALGFTDPKMPSGVWACPNPREMCAGAGGYAYVIDTEAPERATLIGLKPVTQVLEMEAHGLLVFVGINSMVGWGVDGLAWETARLSWEGIRIGGVEGDALRGFGWDMNADADAEFSVDLRTGMHTGGGFGRADRAARDTPPFQQRR